MLPDIDIPLFAVMTLILIALILGRIFLPPSTRSLLKRKRLVAVVREDSANSSSCRYEDDAFLGVFASRLIASTYSSLNYKLLAPAHQSLTLVLEDGTTKVIKIGGQNKLTCARTVEMDGDNRIFSALGLPELPYA